MGAMEIILLIAGGVIFIVSFILPAGRKKEKEQGGAPSREEIRSCVREELESIRSHVDDVVEETVGYAMEKTERSLERLSNEKIMAVSEYSDTVLEEIHKNHQEVMFLYDMLNDKHDKLKSTVSEINRAVEKADAVKPALQLQESGQSTEGLPLSEENQGKGWERLMPGKETMSGRIIGADNVVGGDKAAGETGAGETSRENKEAGSPFVPEGEPNKNGRILELYRKGKSKVDIAKELGLGVGEVKLVLDLYKNTAAAEGFESKR